MLYQVYDPSFLIETRRPLAKWELAEKIRLTPSRTDAVGTNVHPAAGHEETVAETRNEKGDVIGRWVVKWDENGSGTCHEVGYVVKCAVFLTSRIDFTCSLNDNQAFQRARRATTIAFFLMVSVVLYYYHYSNLSNMLITPLNSKSQWPDVQSI